MGRVVRDGKGNERRHVRVLHVPVCSYLCLSRELVFWNVLWHKSQAYIPLSVFLIFLLVSSDSLSARSSRPDTKSNVASSSSP